MVSPDSSASPRRFGAVLAVIVAVAAVVLGVGAVRLSGDDSVAAPRSAASSPASAPASAPEGVDLDLGGVDDADLAACLSPDFAADLDSVEVLYAVTQRTADASAPAVLLRNQDGRLRMCDTAGPDRPSQSPLPAPSQDEPVVSLTNGRATWDCDGTTVNGYRTSDWLAVDSTVDRVEQRFFVDGRPGPWFTTRASNGYVHLQTWLTGPVRPGASLAVQRRVLDAAGDPVQQGAYPTGRRPLAGCTGGGAQIG